jgi:DHA3 family macrolide efflux protein-like MFS transporter
MEQKPQLSSNWKAPFFAIWFGQAFSLLGSGVVQFVLVWWLTIETGSATVLAGATLVAMLPQILLGPLAGPLIDRWNRRLILMVADGIIALSTLWLLSLFSIGAMQVWHVYAVMLIRSAAGAFHFPAMQASTTLMVPREQLARVAGLNQTIQGVTNIASPALGALLLHVSELRAALAVDIVTAALAILPLFFIMIPQPPRTMDTADEGEGSFWQAMRTGLRYVWRWPGLMLILLIATVSNFLLTPAFSLMPLLVKSEFGGDAGLLATLEGLFGIGVIAGGLALSAWGGFRRRIATSLMGLIGIGVGVIAIGLAPATTVWLAIAGMFLTGIMHSMTNGPISAVLQSIVAPNMQGRVLSLVTSLATAMTPLSLLVAGPVAEALGVPAWIFIGGAATGLMGVAGFFAPAILDIENNGTAVESKAPDSEPFTAADVTTFS